MRIRFNLISFNAKPYARPYAKMNFVEILFLYVTRLNKVSFRCFPRIYYDLSDKYFFQFQSYLQKNLLEIIQLDYLIH